MKLSIFALIVLVLSTTACQKMPSTVDEMLPQIEIIDSLKLIENDTTSNFECTYELWFRMPIDHNNPKLGTFPLRAYFSHRGFDRPMVVVIDGYTMYTSSAYELSKILDANQLTIEHRFFSNSRPADSIPWSYLTVKQAAADEHEVIQAFRRYYKQKWLSTGISKSGQTTIYHRSLYPNDVNVSVPYVAPLNFSNHDSRVYDFLANVGTKDDRQKVYNYQVALFRNKPQILPMFEQLASQNNWNFKMGTSRAYDLCVLEYAFAFWQWGISPVLIPNVDAKPEELFEHLKVVDPFSFFEENEIDKIRPFFFQAMTEIGMYGYNPAPFKEFLLDTTEIIFDFTMPEGWRANMNPETMLAVDKWVKEEGNYMLYIYGQYDSWSSTAVNITNKTNAVKMVNPQGCHTTRISSFPPHMRDSIYTVLEKWMKVDLSHVKGSK